MDVSKLSCRIKQVYIAGLSLLWVGPTHMNYINATEFDTASSSWWQRDWENDALDNVRGPLKSLKSRFRQPTL
jgi:hypothetical protein